MGSIKSVLAIVLALAVLCYADRGLEITTHVSAGSWSTSTSTGSGSDNAWFQGKMNPNDDYYTGFFGIGTSPNGLKTYFQNSWTVYRSTYNTIGSTPSINKLGFWVNSAAAPSPLFEGGFRFGSGRVYSFRERVVSSWDASNDNLVNFMSQLTNDAFDGSMITDLLIMGSPDPYVTLLLTATSASTTTSWVRLCRDKPRSNDNTNWECPGGSNSVNTLTSQSRCFALYTDTTPTKAYITCSGLLLVANIESNTISTNNVASYPLGAGDLTSGVYRSAQKRLYAGSTLGLAFEMDTNTFTLLRVTLVISGSGLSPFRSVLLDEPSGSPGVLYWGTSDGIVARVNIRDFEVFSTTSTGAADNLRSLFKGNVDNHIFAGAQPVNTGDTNSNLYKTWKIKKTDCSLYSCGTCLSNPTDMDYCGWCTGTGTCTTSGVCGSNGWTQTPGICPTGVELSPSSGASTGGTRVVYTGTYFIATEPTNYYCKWSTSGTSVVATAVTATTVQCTSPAGTNSATLSINYKRGSSPERPWSGPLTFTFYDCNTGSSSCAACQATGLSECGWCFRSALCQSRLVCNNNNALEWQNTTCPSITTVVPDTGTKLDFHTSQVSLGSVRVRVNTVNWPTGAPSSNMVCYFSGSGLTSPASSFTAGQVICPIPPGLTSTSSNLYTISVRTSGTARFLSSGQTSNTFEVYKCDGLTACFACNRHAGACTWCINTPDTACVDTQVSPTPSCASGFTENSACATITSASVSKISLSAIATAPNVVFQGADLDSPDADLQKCYFSLGLSVQKSTAFASPKTPTSVICPWPNDLFAGEWEISLGNDLYPQTRGLPLTIYDCTSYYSCSSCLISQHPDCDWCLDIGGVGCSDSSHSETCNSGWLATRNVCPSLSSAFPTVLPETGGTLYLSGNHFLTAANVSQTVCAFEDSHGSPITYSNPATMNGTSVQCDAPSTVQFGLVDVFLVANANHSEEYATSTTFRYATCSEFTNCQSCLEGDFCHWCGATCTSTCADMSTSAAVCPVIQSVEPLFSHLSGGERITITGTGFLTNSVKREIAQQQQLQQQYSSLVQAFGAKSGKRATFASPYACDFGGITVSADVDASGTHLYCTTPAKAGIGPSILNVLYQGSIYLTTPGITYFRCDDTPNTKCSFLCTLTANCGWCMGSSTCNSLSQCRALSNSSDPIWQTESCPTAGLSLALAPKSGDLPLTATLSSQFASSVLQGDLACVFDGVGATPVDSVTSVASTDDQGNATTVSQITCQIPPSAASLQTSFYLQWQSKQYMDSVPFEYGDCSLYKQCTRCLAVPFCGWCSRGNKCSMEVECPDNWRKNQCPLNKVAVGVGVGLGSFFFLLLLLLLLFLVRRLRRKSGLVITLKEPNYAEIAWGNDTTLAWKTPSDGYRILDNHLQRRDFLLQVAIAFNCPATEQDAMAKALVYIASVHGNAAEMIQTCVRYEVQTCLTENTLFRNNSVASKMYKFFSRIVGIKYLFNCIARVILELEVLGQRQIAASEGGAAATDGSKKNNDVSLLSMSMELDQTKALGDDIDTETNLLQLSLICQKLLNVLIKTGVKNIPTPFRKIFVEIDNSVMGKFAGSNDAVYKGIGGLFFLRFVCPAITAPHVYGLLENPPNTVTQRQLVLISKVIQNIANMQPPGKKEEYMTALSDFIVQSIPKIIKFYDNLRQAVNMDPESAEADQQTLTVPEEVRLNGLAATWNFLHTDKSKIRQWMVPDECPLDHMQKDDLNTILTECENEYPNAPKKLKTTDPNATAGETKKRKTKA